MAAERNPAVAGTDSRARADGTLKGWLLTNHAAGERVRHSTDEGQMRPVFDLVALEEVKTYMTCNPMSQ